MEINKKYHITFYDHMARDSVDMDEIAGIQVTIGEILGWFAGENDVCYLIETEKCNVVGNARIWSVIKGAIIKVKEVK